MPRGTNANDIPGGAYSYVAARDLGTTDLKSRIVTESDLGGAASEAEPVENMAQRDGERINLGPRFDWVERKSGPLARMRVEDLVTPTFTKPASPAQSVDSVTAAPATPAPHTDPAVAVQRAAERAARDTRTLVDRAGARPARVALVRPFGVPEPTPARKPTPRPTGAKPKSSLPDSTR
jgi:hypothetical protein